MLEKNRIFASSITRTLWRVSGWVTGHNKKDAETAFYLRLPNLANSDLPRDKTKSAPIGVIYAFSCI